MTDFYYDGPVVLTTTYENGPSSEVWLKWKNDGESDLASAIVEALGIDEESMAETHQEVEVHARVRITFDPYRAMHRGEST